MATAGRLRRALSCIGWLLLPAGCSYACEDYEPPAAPVVARETVGLGEDLLEVQDTGQGDKISLSLQRWRGLRYRVHASSQGSFGMEGRRPITAPPLRSVSLFEVLRGSAEPAERKLDGGTVRCVEELMTLEEVSVDALSFKVSDAGSSGAQRVPWLDGTTFRACTDERATMLALEVETVGHEPPTEEVRRQLDDVLDVYRRLPLVLPEQAVGVGARWRLEQPLAIRGAKAHQSTELTLQSFDDQRARLRFKGRITAPRQEVPHPERPWETATLERFRGDSQGEVVLDRLTGVFLSAHYTTTGALSITSEAGNRVTYVATMTSTARSEILAAEPAPPAPSALPAPSAGAAPAPSEQP